MPITEAQIGRRQKYIGASDFAAILGLSPWKTWADVVAEKQGRLEPAPQNVMMNAGNRFETGVLDQAEEVFGPLIRNQFRVFREDGVPIGSNCDAVLLAKDCPVEGKTAGLFGPLREEWGADGTDEIPDMYLVQVQAQILCCRSDVAYLMAFIGGRGFADFTIQRNEPLLKVMQDRAAETWKHVMAGTLPDASLLSLEVCKRFRRTPSKTISIPADFKTEFDGAKAALEAAETAMDSAKQKILTAISAGAAEAGEIEGVGAFTFLEQSRAGFDSKRMKAENPDLAAKYETESRFRVLRFKKSK